MRRHARADKAICSLLRRRRRPSEVAPRTREQRDREEVSLEGYETGSGAQLWDRGRKRGRKSWGTRDDEAAKFARVREREVDKAIKKLLEGGIAVMGERSWARG